MLTRQQAEMRRKWIDRALKTTQLRGSLSNKAGDKFCIIGVAHLVDGMPIGSFSTFYDVAEWMFNTFGMRIKAVQDLIFKNDMIGMSFADLVREINWDTIREGGEPAPEEQSDVPVVIEPHDPEPEPSEQEPNDIPPWIIPAEESVLVEVWLTTHEVSSPIQGAHHGSEQPRHGPARLTTTDRSARGKGTRLQRHVLGQGGEALDGNACYIHPH